MMTIGWIGLGENGFQLAQKLVLKKFTVVAYDAERHFRMHSSEAGMVPTSSIQAVVLHLPSPRIIWCQVAKSERKALFLQLSRLLIPGDIVIIGCDFDETDFMRFQQLFSEKGIRLIGVQDNIRGDKVAYATCKPLFDVIYADKPFFVGSNST